MKDIAQLLQLEENCRNSENLTELQYTIVNETRNVLDYNKAVLFSSEGSSKLKVKTISDISIVEKTSPYVQWLEKTVKSIRKSKDIDTLHTLTIDNEFGSSQLLWIPCSTVVDKQKMYLLLQKDTAWNEDEKKIARHLSSTYRHCLRAVKECGFSTWLQASSMGFIFKSLFFLLLIIAMFIPVNLTVLAPMQIQAKNPLVITSPLNAAIEKVVVHSNQKLNKGDLLVKIKGTELKNNYILAQKTLEVIKAQLKSMEQNSFVDASLQSKISSIKADLELKKAELAFAKYQYELSNIYAQESGLVVINDPNEWTGKSVSVGEKILLIADTNSIEVQIMLGVSDAIFLKEGAEVKVFFDNDPLNTWSAKISKIHYEPQLSPQNILSYKIIAEFESVNQHGYIPKIGLRGTAKIYSDEVTLFFYLFKKPITSLRQLVGW